MDQTKKVKSPILKKEQDFHTPTKPQLYQIKLATRAECASDWIKTLAKFDEITETYAKNETYIGYIKDCQFTQAELGPGMFLPDIDIKFTLARWLMNDQDPTQQFSQTLVILIQECLKKIPNTHIIRESLNFESQYNGDRLEAFEINENDKIFHLENFQNEISKK